MIWNESLQDIDLKNHITKLTGIRKSYSVFTRGEVNIIRNFPQRVLGFERFLSEAECKNALVLANFSSENLSINMSFNTLSHCRDKKELISCLDERKFKVSKTGNLTIFLAGYDFIVLI